MNLRDTQINRIVQKMKQMLARVEKAENEAKGLKKRWGFLPERHESISEI